MERNENGTPRMGNGNTAQRRGTVCENRGNAYENRESAYENRGTAYENRGTCHNHTCGGDGSCLDDMPLAYAYAPSQKFRMLYSASDALKHGTLFEELFKPKEVYGNE